MGNMTNPIPGYGTGVSKDLILGPEVSARFWSKVDASGDCWIYTEYCTPNGYGRFWDPLRRTKWYAHRFAWTDLVGPIPTGFVVDHRCFTRNCVNIDHLELVTQRTNVLRSSPFVRRTHCPQGHPYDSTNTRRNKKFPSRYCMICNRDRQAARRARPKAAS